MTKESIVLAYSGGLDTSITIPWLKENYDAEIIAVCVNVGMDLDWEAVQEKALKSGASHFYNPHVTEEFAQEFIFPAIQANLKYQGTYLLGTALARPIISKYLVDIAHQHGASAICHGCTGKGNDQVRFETAIAAFDPTMKVIAPWRIWDIKSREDAIDYAKAHNVPITNTIEKIYSEDENLIHISHEGGDIEQPENKLNYQKFLSKMALPMDAPDEMEEVSITFNKGCPTHINGTPLSPAEIINEANQIAGKHGVGLLDWVEDRMIGMKSRGVYESPGMTLLMEAHQRLESLTLTKETIDLKYDLGYKWAKLIYEGQWYSMASQAIQAFITFTQEIVTGEVKLVLYKGNIFPAGIISDYALFDKDVSGFGADDLFDHHDAEGFINVTTLATKIQSRKGVIQ